LHIVNIVHMLIEVSCFALIRPRKCQHFVSSRLLFNAIFRHWKNILS